MAENAHRLELRRVLEASPDEVFDALTQAERVAQWWCPAGYCARKVDLDLRLGGKYRIEMHADNGPEIVVVRGEYREIAPPVRLVFTHVFASAPERALADAGLVDHETLVTIEVRARGANSELTLTQQELPGAMAMEMMSGGWGGMLHNLKATLS